MRHSSNIQLDVYNLFEHTVYKARVYPESTLCDSSHPDYYLITKYFHVLADPDIQVSADIDACIV